MKGSKDSDFNQVSNKNLSKILPSRAGVGNLLTITGHMNCALSLAGCKFNWFCPEHLYNSPGNYAKELFKPSKDFARLGVCIEKNILGFGFLLPRWRQQQAWQKRSKHIR